MRERPRIPREHRAGRGGATRRVRIAAGGALAVVVAAGFLLWYLSLDATLEFLVVDSTSGDWAWDATAIADGREMRLYYQSDHGPESNAFTRLAPGETTLTISAPSYVSQSLSVPLRRGPNTIERPIELVGYEIAGLSRWVIFEDWSGDRLSAELRPLNAEGRAVRNHPALDLWVGARISVQEQTDANGQSRRRGSELFSGQIEWQWNPAPEAVFRYSAFFPASSIRTTAEPAWVIDYVIVVPDPRRIEETELATTVSEVLSGSAAEIVERLAPFEREGLFRVFTYTSWDVVGAMQ